ncbi:MAG: hypothetical protein WBI82_15790 [Sphaerochaeta sp.]
MPPFPPQGAGYLTLLSRHSLGNGTMVMLPLLSLRWGIKWAETLSHAPAQRCTRCCRLTTGSSQR